MPEAWVVTFALLAVGHARGVCPSTWLSRRLVRICANFWLSFVSQNALGVANSLVMSYLSGFFSAGTELEREMIIRIVEVKFSILSLDAFLGVVRVGDFGGPSFASLLKSEKCQVAILRVPFLLIMECFSVFILRLFDRMGANPVFTRIAIAPICEVNFTALSDQWWVPYEYIEGMLIALRGPEPFKLILLDGTEEWYDG